MPEWGSYVFENGVRMVNPVFSEVNQVKRADLRPSVDLSSHQHIWENDPKEETETWEGIICRGCGIGKRFPKGTLVPEQVQSPATNAE